MDKTIINKVCAQVYQKAPEVRNCQPSISEQGDGKYLFIFSGTAFGSNGKPIPRIVRAVSDKDGKIIKISSSR
ncbi:MAG: hypothetical protein GYA12_04470 [Chloroflexi bacterium]|jgi:hypothetical protein|nr:hypothetical protein [Chloroflexota bacterium]BCY19018.1 hypothetical protein hrd7_28670 [Leptolinea sp. HRD-7]